MFAKTWRRHWGLSEDPFAYEDADKDPILARLDEDAVHASFDRVFGNFSTPGPGIVFGEKGSGKSGLRLAISSRVDAYNESLDGSDAADGRILAVEYSDFDLFLENLRKAERIPAGKEETASEVSKRFRTSDHLDALLSLAVTALVDELERTPARAVALAPKQKVHLLALCALYYHSKRRTSTEAFDATRRALGFRAGRAGAMRFGRLLLTGAAAALAAVPHVGALLGDSIAGVGDWNTGPAGMWYGLGGVLFGLTWLVGTFSTHALWRTASNAAHAVRVLPPNPAPLAGLLSSIRPELRKELPLPVPREEATRYDLLQSLVGAIQALRYDSLYVLMDRVDEATLLAGREDLTRAFVEKLLDHRLLQFPNVALKLFLPVELGQMVLGSSSEDQKRMRLDKSNTVQELRWTGNELYEIANQRLGVATGSPPESSELRDFFSDEIDSAALRNALQELGTPRYAFGFLSSLFTDYVRNLPNELEPDAQEWRVPRTHFDVVHSSWSDKARHLRQALN